MYRPSFNEIRFGININETSTQLQNASKHLCSFNISKMNFNTTDISGYMIHMKKKNKQKSINKPFEPKVYETFQQHLINTIIYIDEFRLTHLPRPKNIFDFNRR